MRLATRLTIWTLLLYLIALVLIMVWGSYELERSSDEASQEIGMLLVEQISAAISADYLDDIDHRSSVPVRRELVEQIETFVKHSGLVKAIQLVDENGDVVASYRGEELGTKATGFPTPASRFTQDSRALLVPSTRAEARRGRFALEVPLMEGNRPRAYLRVLIASSALDEMHRGSLRRLVMVALATLIVLMLISLFLHFQLQRSGRFLATAFEQALSGTSPSPKKRTRKKRVRRQDEFTAALEAAGRLGRELVAERKKGTVQSHQSRRMLELGKLPDVGVILLDDTQSLDFMNERGREFLGIREGEEAREQVDDLKKQLVESLGRPLSELGAEEYVNCRLGRGEDARTYRCQVHQIFEGECVGFLLLIRDLGLIRAMEEDLQAATQLRGLARLYMGMAHDLKAPLNAMSLNLELLRRSLVKQSQREESGLPDPRSLDWVGVIQSELGRLNRGLQFLLAQTAPPRRSRQRFDIRSLVEELGLLLGAQARKQDVELLLDTGDDPVEVEADRDYLKQALISIALNALEVMPKGGTLRLAVVEEGGKAMVRVHDTGPGIPEDVRSSIFELHFTTKESGTGIGLYVARSIIEGQRGRLKLEETGPEGSVFRISLPRAGDDDSRDSRDSAESNDAIAAGRSEEE